MTTRTFKQFGQAYGSIPTTIVATIDGVQVFSGSVNTVDEPIPTGPVPNLNSELFTWTNTVDFAGTQSFSISVMGSPLLLSDTTANYPFLPGINGNNVSNSAITDSVAHFTYFYTSNIDGIERADPFTNVTIGGVSRERETNNSELTGQWHWLIPVGSTFNATLNVAAGTELTADPETTPTP